jgi:hypothetical protein
VKARGQALVEYLVVATVLAAALFAPWPGGDSTSAALLESLTRWYRNFALVLAIS